MAFYKQDIVDVNLETGVIHRSFLNHTIGHKDDDADRFGIRAFRNGEPVDLSGAQCQAVFMAPDGTNIALTSYGTVSGNEAYVTLPQACYNVEGQFCLAIKLVGGGVTATVRIIDGVVDRTGATGAVAPTEAVPTYQEILAVYAQMQEDIADYESVVANQNDQINSLKSALTMLEENIVVNTEALTDFAQGSISGDTGSNSSSNTRCRTPDYKICNGNILKMTVKDGFKFSWRRYSTQSSSGFNGTSEWMAGTQYIYNSKGQYFRFVVVRNNGSALAPSDLPSDILSWTEYNATDRTLSLEDKPANAKVVGDDLHNIVEERTISMAWQTGYWYSNEKQWNQHTVSSSYICSKESINTIGIDSIEVIMSDTDYEMRIIGRKHDGTYERKDLFTGSRTVDISEYDEIKMNITGPTLDVDDAEATITFKMIGAIKQDVTTLMKTEAFTPNYEYEQGAFTTSTWKKASSSSSQHNNYIRFVRYPSLRGIGAVFVSVAYGYRAYICIKGRSTSIQTQGAKIVYLSESDQTELNVVLHKLNTTITPSDADKVQITLLPFMGTINDKINGITLETDGLMIPDESTPFTVGIYGASVPGGQKVSDYSQQSTGPVISLADIGYSDVYITRYAGDKSWARKLKARLESHFSNVTVENWSIAGVSAGTYYMYLEKCLENNNSPINTQVDAAIIMLGNNGRYYSMESNITELGNIVNLFKRNGAQVFLMTTTPAFNTNSDYVINTYQVIMCCKLAASVNGVCAIDAYNWIEDYCEQNGISIEYDPNAEKNFLTSDNLHPGDLGHDIIYKAIKSLLKV